MRVARIPRGNHGGFYLTITDLQDEAANAASSEAVHSDQVVWIVYVAYVMSPLGEVMVNVSVAVPPAGVVAPETKLNAKACGSVVHGTV